MIEAIDAIDLKRALIALRLDPEDKCACRVAMLANMRRTVTWAIKRPHTVNGRCSQCGGLSDEPGWTGVE